MAALKPLLTGKIKKKRVQFAKEHKHWTVDELMELMWSKESAVQVLSSHLVKVRRPAYCSRYNKQFTVLTVKHSSCVMVWGCLNGKMGRGGLYFLPKGETMNSERYKEGLSNNMFLSIFLLMKLPHSCTTSPYVTPPKQWKHCSATIISIYWNGLGTVQTLIP